MGRFSLSVVTLTSVPATTEVCPVAVNSTPLRLRTTGGSGGAAAAPPRPPPKPPNPPKPPPPPPTLMRPRSPSQTTAFQLALSSQASTPLKIPMLFTTYAFGRPVSEPSTSLIAAVRQPALPKLSLPHSRFISGKCTGLALTNLTPSTELSELV